MKNRKSATKAYRLDVSLIEELRKAARHEGVSENSLVQDLLWRRVRIEPIIHAFPYIVLSTRTLTHILGTANPDGLEMAAADLGKRNFGLVRELYESAGKELQFSEYLMEVLDKQVHWFEVEGAENKPERLTLRHECGMKWSIFLKGFLTGAYVVVSLERIKMTLHGAYVSVELPHELLPSNRD